MKQTKPDRKIFLQQFYHKNRCRFSLALTSTVLLVLVNLALSALMQQLIDVISQDTAATLPELVIATVLLLAGIVLCSLLAYYSKPRFYSRAMQQYKDYVFHELTKKSISAFTGEQTSTYVSALSNDAASIERNYLEGLFPLLQNLLFFVGAFAMMLWYSPLLTLAAFVLSFLPVLVSLLTGNRLAGVEKTVSDRNESFTATLKDSLNGFSVIKSFKAEQAIFRLFARSNKAVEDTKEHRRKLTTIISSLGTVAGATAQMGVFLFGAFLAIRGSGVTAGVVIVFVQLMNFVIQPIAQVPELWANRKASLALIDKLAAALQDSRREEGAEIPCRLEDGIELRNVTFSYEPGKQVLHGVSARFEAGRSYAIVGGSGSGKSTLLNLLMASHSGYGGDICFDGAELRGIRAESLYDLVSIVQQNVFIFNSSVRDNITMFREFDKAEVDEAIRLSGLSELIAARGEDYLCGENGSGLSGGEKQRISIARSLLRKTPVLLMDEATAALDAETAYYITSSILQLDGLTRIVVTHALDETLLRRYDRIFTLKNGRLIESGTFDELMAKKEYFYSLFTVSQS